MRLGRVFIVEGDPGAGGGYAGPFDLRIERAGWVLVDPAAPGAERRWAWEDIGGLSTDLGGHTPDGEPATGIDVVVNGWPVHLVVSAEQLPHPGVALLTASAPVGHDLRQHGGISAAPDRPAATLAAVPAVEGPPAPRRARLRQLPIRSAGATGIAAATAVAVTVAGTVIAVALLGSSGGTPPQLSSGQTGPRPTVTTPSGSSSTTPAPSSTTTPAGAPSTTAGGTLSVPIPPVVTSTTAGTTPAPGPKPATAPASKTTSTKSSGGSTKTTKSSGTTKTTSGGSSGSSGSGSSGSGSATTTPGSPASPTSTAPGATTTAAPATTTTTRPRRRPPRPRRPSPRAAPPRP
ncbi:MAG TPA: hypothetical protein VMB72_13905, partial [Acidimicrobiales bacterium]|nr:hypothetical protein [Acidimicrobiales bacterium]